MKLSWKKIELGECCEIVSGSTPRRNRPEYWGGEIPWITPKDLSDLDSKYLQLVPEFITEEGYNSCSTKMLPEGSLLFSSRAPIGLLAVTNLEVCTNQGFKSLVPKDGVDIDYLYYCILSQKESIKSKGRGATFKEISKSILSKVQIPLPPLSEQRRIAAILDKADALRRLDAQLLARYEELVQSVFLELFGIKSSDYSNWEEVPIKNLAATEKGSMRTGPFGSNLKHEEFTENGEVAVLGIDNAVNNEFAWGKKRFITKEKYKELKRYTIKPRDVIITIMGTLGRTAVIPEDIPLTINTKHLAAITLNPQKANPYYIAYCIHTHPFVLAQLNANRRGAIMSGLNLTIIRDLKVKLPPIGLQDKFEKYLTNVKSQKDLLKASSKECEGLFQSLLQRAFKGEL